jgi:serine/threonine protein kinase
MLIKNQVLTILCHDAQILHRDISPNNIMLIRDNDGKVLHVLLIDFDYASTLDSKNEQSDTPDHFRTVGPFSFALPRRFILRIGNTTFYGHRDFVGKG